MRRSLSPSSSPRLDPLYQHLQRALTALCPDDQEDVFALNIGDPPDAGESCTAFRVKGPDEASIRGELELIPTDARTCDVRVETAEGHARHFRYERPGEGMPRTKMRRAVRRMATFLLNEIDQRRAASSSEEPASSNSSSPLSVLLLDKQGTIQHLTRGARQLLEYAPDASVEPNFFSHVHGQNLRRVMRDLAHMVAQQKHCARWLLRLRTGSHRWRWYRAIAKNRLDDSGDAIRVRLRALSDR